MKKILLIGIGAGNPDYITVQAIKALNQVDVFFILDKGSAKDKLIAFRKEICARFITEKKFRFAEADIPERAQDDEIDYQATVKNLNYDKQELFEKLITNKMKDDECGAFLS